MAISPYTEAAKALAAAAFGDPALAAENEKLESEAELNALRGIQAEAAAEASRASAANSYASAKDTQNKLAARGKITPEMFDFEAPIRMGRELNPGEFGPDAERPAGIEDVRGRAGGLAALLGQSGELDAANLGDILTTIEGITANSGITNPDARLRNANAGMGSPYSETQVKAQDFANLPETQRQAIVGAVPMDQVFGGALLSTRSPEQLALMGEEKNAPASYAEFVRTLENPNYANFLNSNKKGTTFTTNPDGTVTYSEGPGVGFGTVGNNRLDENIINNDAALARVGNIRSQFKSQYQTVPFKAFQAVTNMQDLMGAPLTPEQTQSLTEFSTFRRGAVENLNLTIKEITGAQLSPGEAVRITQQLPNPGTGIFDGDGPTVFDAKLTDLERSLGAAQARALDLKSRGITAITDQIAQDFPLENYLPGANNPIVPTVTEVDIDNMSEQELDNFLGTQ